LHLARIPNIRRTVYFVGRVKDDVLRIWGIRMDRKRQKKWLS
jgi:hypothetical protein